MTYIKSKQGNDQNKEYREKFISNLELPEQAKKYIEKIDLKSPRTLKACNELGMDPDYFFKIK